MRSPSPHKGQDPGAAYRAAVRATAVPIKGRRYGSAEPRICTPPLRVLTPTTSLGYNVIEFATDVLKISLLPWQRALLIRMLELLPNNSLRFRTVLLLVARQSGKSTLSQIVALWFMYVYGSKLILGTAQDLDTAEEVWQGAVDMVTELGDDDLPVRPELHALFDRAVMVNGKKSLDLTTGQRYKVKAATRRAGRGLTGDVILLDELREHQSWDAWAAISKTTIARDTALILALSNAGDATSIVLRHLRQLALTSLVESGHEELRAELDDAQAGVVPDDIEEAETLADDDSLGIFEWSATPGCDLADWAGIAQANPALGHTISERAVTSSRRTDPEWVFRTEILCQWSSGTLEGPFPPGAWDVCRRVAGDDLSNLGVSSIAGAAAIGVGVDVSADRSTAHIAFAGLNQHGIVHVEVVATRAGPDWVVDWLAERAGQYPWTGIALQGRSAPCSPLVDDLTAADLPVMPWQGSDLTSGTTRFYDMVAAETLRHLDQPVLDVAAATAVTRPAGDGAWLWNRRQSPTDISPLVAATAAVWALASEPVNVESAYETGELVIA